MLSYTLELDEGGRQLILLALAHLSVERPGFDSALNLIALKIDNNSQGRAVLYDQFRVLEDSKMTDADIRALITKHSAPANELGQLMYRITTRSPSFDIVATDYTVMPYYRPTLDAQAVSAVQAMVFAIIKELLPDLERSVREDVKAKLLRAV